MYVDDHVGQAHLCVPGRPKKLTDAELLCLAVAQVLLGFPAQHHWLRLCSTVLGGMFPYLPKQPGLLQTAQRRGPVDRQGAGRPGRFR